MWDFFTHGIAVHEENTEGLSALIFQTCEVGKVAVKVVCALEKKQESPLKFVVKHILERSS